MSANCNESWSQSCYTIPGAVFTVFPGVLLILVIVLGNGLVIIAVAKDRKLKSMRQNWLIVSLAFADFFVGLVIVPLTLTYEIAGHWPFGSILCELWKALDVLFVTASILNLCAISLDRYWAVTDPLQYSRNRTKLRMRVMIASTWLVSLAISLPPLVGWRGEKVEGQCMLSRELGYVLYSALGSFWIPVFVVLFVYGKIYAVVRHRMKMKMKEVAVKEASLAAVAVSRITVTQRLMRHTVLTFSALNALVKGAEDFSSSYSVTPPQSPQRPNQNPSSSEEVFSPGKESLTMSTTPLKRDFDQRNFDTVTTNSTTALVSPPANRRQENHLRRPSTLGDCGRSYSSSGPIRKQSAPLRKISSMKTQNTKENGGTDDDALGETLGGNDGRRSPESFRAVLQKFRGKRTESNSSESATRKALNQHYSEKKRHQKRKDRQATLVLGMVLVAFLVCWLPFFTLYVLGAFNVVAPETVFDVFFWFGYCNSALNPMIYAICNGEFRAAFYRILCRKGT